jgi:uncharacterized membrane protein YozB (DUF420 family)
VNNKVNYTQYFQNFGLAWGVIALVLLILAWRAAVNGNIVRHRTLMIVLMAGTWLFVVSYLSRYVIPGVEPKIPTSLIPWIMFHGTVALIPFVGGSLMVWARLSKGNSDLKVKINQSHRRYGRILLPLWVITLLGGIANYWLIGGQ